MYANKNKTKNSKARTVATKADSTKLSSTDSRYDAGDYEAVPASIRKIRDARNKELEEQNAIPAEEIIARQEAEIAELKRQAAAGSAPSTMADKYRNAIDDLEDHPTFKNPESMADFGDYEAVASTARFAAAERDPNQKVFRAKPSVATRKVASPSDLSPGDYEAVAAAARHAVSPDEYLAAKEAQSDNEEAESVAQDSTSESGYMTDAEAARASRQAPSREVPEYTAPAPAPADNEVHSELYTPPMAAQSPAVSSSSDEVHSEPYTPPKAPQAPPAPVSAADYTVQEYVPPAQRNKYSDDGNYDVGGGPIYSPTSGKRIASFEDMAPGDYEAVADSSYDDSEMDLADGSYDFDKFLAGAPSLQTPRAPQPSPEESDWADLGPSVTEDIDDVDITDEQTRALTEAIAQETLNNQPGTQFEDIIDNVIAKVLERKKAEDAAKAAAQQPEQPEQKPEEQKSEQPEQKAEEKPAEQTEAQPTAEKQTAEEPQKSAPSEVIDPSTPIEDIPALIMAQLDSADGEANDDDIRKSIDAALIGKLTTGELTLDSVQSVRNKILDEIHEMQEEEARILAQLEGKPEKHPFDPDFLPADIAVEDIPDAVIAELDNIEGEVSDDEVKESIDKVMIAKLAKGELTLDDFQDARGSIFDTLGIETAEEQAEETEPEPLEETVEESTEPAKETEPEPVEETEPEPVEEAVEEPTEPEPEPQEENAEPEEVPAEEPVEEKTEEAQAEEPTELVEETEPVEETEIESESLEEAAEEEPIQGPDVELSEAAEQTEESSEEMIEEPVVEPVEEPIEETAEESLDESVEEPTEESGEEPVDEVAEEPVEESVDEPVEVSAEEPVEEETAQEQAPAEVEHAQDQETPSEDEEEKEETIGIPVPKEPTVLEYDPYADVFVNPKDESEEPAEDEEDTDESSEEEDNAEEKADEESFDDEQTVDEETVSTEEPVAETEESEESSESEELLETPLSAAAVLAMQDQAEEAEDEEETADEEPVEETEEEPAVEEVEESVEGTEPEQVEETEETEEAAEEEPETEEAEEPVEEAEEETQPEQTEESEGADKPAEEPEEHDSVLDMQITFDDIFRNPFVNDFEPLETPERPTEEAVADETEETETDEPETESETEEEEPAPVEEEPIPVEEEPAPVEEEPAQEESPAEEQASAEEEPAQEESSAEEQAPAEEESAQEESPAEEQAPVEEESEQEESPAEEQAPAEEEAQPNEVSEEEPAPVDEEPAQEESPVEEPEAPDEYAEAKEKRHEDMQNALLMAMIDDKEKTFSDAVNYMIDQDELNARTLRTRMPIDKDTLDRVIKERDFIPDKKTALAICFALRLTWEDSIRLLYKAGYSLNDTERYDLTIEYLMRRGVYDQNMINSVLRGSGLEGFGTPQSEI